MRENWDLLWTFEGQDREDGPAVHPPHAGAITHVTEQDGGHLWAELKQEKKTKKKHYNGLVAHITEAKRWDKQEQKTPETSVHVYISTSTKSTADWWMHLLQSRHFTRDFFKRGKKTTPDFRSHEFITKIKVYGWLCHFMTQVLKSNE